MPAWCGPGPRSAGAGQCSLLTGNGICLERAASSPPAVAPTPAQVTGDHWPVGVLTVSTPRLSCIVYSDGTLTIRQIHYHRHLSDKQCAVRKQSDQCSCGSACTVVDDIFKPSRPCSNRRFPNVNCYARNNLQRHRASHRHRRCTVPCWCWWWRAWPGCWGGPRAGGRGQSWTPGCSSSRRSRQTCQPCLTMVGIKSTILRTSAYY